MPNSFCYRPWGALEWVLWRTRIPTWQFLGCIGTEERSTAAWPALQSLVHLDRSVMLRINDGGSRFADTVKARLMARTREFEAAGGSINAIEEHALMEQHHQIVSVAETSLTNGPSDFIVDITSMPKRFFFPLLRRLLESPTAARSIVVTYTVPREYTTEHLSERHNDWAHLPLFSGGYPQPQPDMLIVSVGFEALGLVDQIEQGFGGVPVKLLIPFPAPAKAFARSLELSCRLQRFRQANAFTSLRADAKDASDAFTRLTALVRGGRTAILAPFGPKPMSLAMCVFATLTNSQVFYCQPTVYHPDYSLGVSMIAGRPEIYAYCLRLAGRNFYTL